MGQHALLFVAGEGELNVQVIPRFTLIVSIGYWIIRSMEFYGLPLNLRSVFRILHSTFDTGAQFFVA